MWLSVNTNLRFNLRGVWGILINFIPVCIVLKEWHYPQLYYKCSSLILCIFHMNFTLQIYQGCFNSEIKNIYSGKKIKMYKKTILSIIAISTIQKRTKFCVKTANGIFCYKTTK